MEADARQRLWEHRQNLNADFNNISNYFLLAQSFLISTAVATFGTDSIITVLLPTLGLIVTAIWIYVQGKQKFILDAAKRACAVEFPEYRDLQAARKARRFPLSNTMLLTYVLPSIFAVAWIVLLIAR